jgi:hypothetical protein
MKSICYKNIGNQSQNVIEAITGFISSMLTSWPRFQLQNKLWGKTKQIATQVSNRLNSQTLLVIKQL